MKKILFSFRFRIFISLILVGFFACTITSRVILENYETKTVSNRVTEVTGHLKVLANHLVTYNYLSDSSSDVINAELSQISTLFNGRVLVINSSYRVIYDTYGISDGKYMIAKEVLECFNGNVGYNTDSVNRYIEVAVPIREGKASEEDSRVLGVLLASVSLANIDSNIAHLSRISLMLEIVISIFVFALAAFISSRMIKPITEISESINHVASFEGEDTITSKYTETTKIAKAFNEMYTRFKAMDDSRQEFVSNVSHELKTPITSMKVLADSLIAQDNVPIEVYQEFMQDIAAEIDREDSIITDLLALVRMEKGDSVLNVKQVDANEMLELIIKRLGPIARKNEIDLIYESRREVIAMIDEVKITLAISNLIENAIKYNKHPGWVKIILDADHQYMTCAVIDSGIGIPEDSINHIFERFYRVDKSHSRQIGGTGLGLAIARKTILLHRGSIKVNSVVGEGTTFLVRLPLKYISRQDNTDSWS